MNSKRLYITPLINRIAIDKTISIAMATESEPTDPDDDWDPWGKPPPPPSGIGSDSPPSQFNKPIVPNSFEDNPFK